MFIARDPPDGWVMTVPDIYTSTWRLPHIVTEVSHISEAAFSLRAAQNIHVRTQIYVQNMYPCSIAWCVVTVHAKMCHISLYRIPEILAVKYFTQNSILVNLTTNLRAQCMKVGGAFQFAVHVRDGSVKYIQREMAPLLDQ